MLWLGIFPLPASTLLYPKRQIWIIRTDWPPGSLASGWVHPKGRERDWGGDVDSPGSLPRLHKLAVSLCCGGLADGPPQLNSLSPSFDNLLLPWHLRLPIAILQAATLSFVISLHPAHIFANNPLTKPSQIIQFECAMCFLPDSYKILLWTAPRNQIPRNTWSRRKTHSKEQVRLPGTYPLPRFPQQDEGLSPSCAE